MSTCQINQPHCESCGSTDNEDLTTGDQGYSACCNELITDQRSCRDHHGADARYQAALDAAVATAGYASREAWIDADPAAWELAADAAWTAVHGH